MRFPSRTIALAVAAALVVTMLGVYGCGPGKDAAASVNGVSIDKSAVDAQIQAVSKVAGKDVFAGPNGAKMRAEYAAKILDNLIQMELLKQAAKDEGIDITDKQVDDYIKRLEAGYGGRKGLEAAMKASGISMDRLTELVRSRLIAEALGKKLTSSLKVTDAQIEAYYKDNLKQFYAQTLVHVQHVLVAEKDKTLAQQILKDVQGGSDIGGLAKKYSIDASNKDKGGDLDWAPVDRYVAEFSKAATEMKVNEVRLVHTQQFGWHVMKLLGKQPARQKPLSEVKDQVRTIIQQSAQNKALTEYIAQLKKKANIQVLDAQLKSVLGPSDNGTSTAGK